MVWSAPTPRAHLKPFLFSCHLPRNPPDIFHRETPAGGKFLRTFSTAKLRPGENPAGGKFPRKFSTAKPRPGEISPAQFSTVKLRPGGNSPANFRACVLMLIVKSKRRECNAAHVLETCFGFSNICGHCGVFRDVVTLAGATYMAPRGCYSFSILHA